MSIKFTAFRAAAAASALLLTSFTTAEAVSPRIVSAASATTFTYSLAAGATSPAFAIPASTPVQLIGIQLSVGFRGVGQASLLSIAGASGFIEWVGLESTAGAAITHGFSGVAGTHIVFLDFGHCVDVEVAGVAGSSRIQVHNTCTGARTGRVTLIW